MKRQPGFYWVKVHGHTEWTIAQWHQIGYWSVIDSRHHFDDQTFSHIRDGGGPILEPEQ